MACCLRTAALQVAFALDYCHRMGIASRNVKLDNLLVMGGEPGTRRVIKLCDFGLSAECRRDGPHGCTVRPSLHLGPESLGQGKDGPPCDAKVRTGGLEEGSIWQD